MIDKLKAKLREAIIPSAHERFQVTADTAFRMVAERIDRLLEGAKVVYTTDGEYFGLEKDDEGRDTHASLVLFNEPIVENKRMKETLSVKVDKDGISFGAGCFLSHEGILQGRGPIFKIRYDEWLLGKPAEPVDQRVTVEEIEYVLNGSTNNERKDIIQRLKEYGIRQ